MAISEKHEEHYKSVLSTVKKACTVVVGPEFTNSLFDVSKKTCPIFPQNINLDLIFWYF